VEPPVPDVPPVEPPVPDIPPVEPPVPDIPPDPPAPPPVPATPPVEPPLPPPPPPLQKGELAPGSIATNKGPACWPGVTIVEPDGALWAISLPTPPGPVKPQATTWTSPLTVLRR